MLFRHNMAEPKRFESVLLAGFFLVFLSIALFGGLAYYTFGNACPLLVNQAGLHITILLGNQLAYKIIMTIGIACLVVKLLTTVPLFVFCIVNDFMNEIYIELASAGAEASAEISSAESSAEVNDKVSLHVAQKSAAGMHPNTLRTCRVVLFLTSCLVSFALSRHLEAVTAVVGAAGMLTCVLFPMMLYGKVHAGWLFGNVKAAFGFSLVFLVGAVATVMVIVWGV